MPRRPLILVSNDDGIEAPGLDVLARAVSSLGDVWAVAPLRERSASGHAITLTRPLLISEHGRRRFGIDGTPADAVFVAFGGLLPRAPDLVLSGVNAGPNLGTDAFYSGTVAAAREGAFRGVPSLAVSLTRGRGFETAARAAVPIARAMLEAPPEALRHRSRGLLLNLNVPPGRRRRLRITRLGVRHYPDAVQLRDSPRGGRYAWIAGFPVGSERSPGTDTWAVARGDIALTALALDLTQHGEEAARFAPFLETLENA
jgi:5'-nucleotidase